MSSSKSDKVASSRAGKSGDENGTYVGRTEPDDAVDVGETGAEARSDEDEDK